MPDDSPTIVYVMLGSNTNAPQRLADAVRLLRNHADVLALSPVYQTAAQGDAHDSADYLNMAVKLSTPHSPAAFKTNVLRAIERQLGRTPERVARGYVDIDLDIALWGDAPITYNDGVKTWRSPDEDILRFAHVAVPLAELAPDLPHLDTAEPLRAIAARLTTPHIFNRIVNRGALEE